MMAWSMRVIHGPEVYTEVISVSSNRLELRGQDDFQQFAVVGIIEDHVA